MGKLVILFNLGKTSAPLDIHIYPKSDMTAGTMRLAQGVGGQRVSFPDAVTAEDDIALFAESRECTRNGAAAVFHAGDAGRDELSGMHITI